ncbi:MAG: sigma-70 family RNA polymerase sigma factor [Anaerolineae bacterium]|nr:sigma-70 family RNA polymerase sigma factor [Anaerolineae bacterium]
MTDEKTLLQRAQVYDPDELSELYDRYAPAIYNYLYRRVLDAQTAEDLTGDVFLSVLEAIQSDNFWRTSFRAWLYRIAGNKVIDYFRQSNKMPEYPAGDFIEFSPADDTMSPDNALMEKLSRNRLHDAISLLPPSQQEVLTLRFGQRLKTKEVAEILGKTVGAVEALQNRALTSLRKNLEMENFGSDAASLSPTKVKI